jgi:hypothetical protein
MITKRLERPGFRQYSICFLEIPPQKIHDFLSNQFWVRTINSKNFRKLENAVCILGDDISSYTCSKTLGTSLLSKTLLVKSIIKKWTRETLSGVPIQLGESFCFFFSFPSYGLLALYSCIFCYINRNSHYLIRFVKKRIVLNSITNFNSSIKTNETTTKRHSQAYLTKEQHHFVHKK